MSNYRIAHVAGIHDATTGALVGFLGADGLEYLFPSAPVGGSLPHAAGTTYASSIKTITADGSVGATDSTIIANKAGTLTLTLPSAASFPGRELRVRTIQAQTVVSASANVVPMIGGSAGTAILAATAGKWADLQSDGANWQITGGN